MQASSQAPASPETLREIWEQERGSLGELRALTPEREARCRERIAHARKKGKDIAQFLADFREAVARAAATPFCCGAGPGGWIANFDWLICNDTNYLKVARGPLRRRRGNFRNCKRGAQRSECTTRVQFPRTILDVARDGAR